MCDADFLLEDLRAYLASLELKKSNKKKTSHLIDKALKQLVKDKSAKACKELDKLMKAVEKRQEEERQEEERQAGRPDAGPGGGGQGQDRHDQGPHRLRCAR